MAVGANARNYILVSDEGEAVRRRMLNSSTAVSAGDMVTLSAGALVEITGASSVGAIGVCAADIAASSYGPVYVSGMFKGAAKSGVNFALGDKVYAYDKDSLYTGTSGATKPVGKVVHTDPSSGGTVHFELWSIVLHELDLKA